MALTHVHYLPGGGLGDVFREAVFHNVPGILWRWKTLHPEARLRVVLMTHNPSSAELLEGQHWIDDLQVLRFPVEETWKWEDAYTRYPEAFEGLRELRFTISESRSLYRSDLGLLRPRHPNVETIPPVGRSWSLAESSHPTLPDTVDARRLLHPYAGQDIRAFSPELQAQLVDYMGGTPLIVGGEYAREGHGTETAGVVLPVRALVSRVANARYVVATESSVYYMASMLGVPVALLYAEGQTFDLMLRGRSSWDWYFNLQDPRSLFLRLPLDLAKETRLREWIARW